MMYANDLVAIREKLEITQITMAERMGLSVRALQDLESTTRRSSLRRMHEKAIKYVVIEYAIERKNPDLLGTLRPDLQNLIMDDFAQMMMRVANLENEKSNTSLRAA